MELSGWEAGLCAGQLELIPKFVERRGMEIKGLRLLVDAQSTYILVNELSGYEWGVFSVETGSCDVVTCVARDTRPGKTKLLKADFSSIPLLFSSKNTVIAFRGAQSMTLQHFISES